MFAPSEKLTGFQINKHYKHKHSCKHKLKMVLGICWN